MTNVKRRIVGALVASVLGATSVGLVAAPAHAANKGLALTRGEQLNRNDYIQRTIASGVVRLRLQGDGNLVLSLYTAGGGLIKICKGFGTNPTGIKAIYQHDGNFVVYSATKALWGSDTVGASGETVDMNSEGRLYVGNTPITGACKV